MELTLFILLLLTELFEVVGGGGGNNLNKDLVSYYKLDGNADDSKRA